MQKFLLLGGLLVISGCGLPMMGGSQVESLPATPVFFQPFSAALDAPALAAIAEAAKQAESEPDAPVAVTGAADAVGNTQGSVVLSKMRARVVAAQLEADGVTASRISARGIGEVGGPSGLEQGARRAVIRIGA